MTFRKIALVCICLMLAAACSRGLTKEKYIEVMAELGCKGAGDGTPAAAEILEEKGVTQEQIQKFRAKDDANEMMKTSLEIANRVMACHGMGAQQ